MISNGFTYVAFLMCLAGLLLAAEKYTKSPVMKKVFNFVPPLVWIYVLNMFFCTFGVFNFADSGAQAAYSGLKNNILYAMIFVMLLRCDIKKLAKLGGRMVAIFLGGSVSIMIGFIVAFIIFKGSLGGGELAWPAMAALCASWIGGSGNMAAMEAAFPIDPGTYGCALAVDTVYYSVWIALLLIMVNYASKWDKAVKADTSKLEAVAEAASKEVANEKKKATSADGRCLIGVSLAVSALSQWVGGIMNNGLCAIGLDMFGASTMTTVFVSVLGLVCAQTKLGKVPAVEELSSVYLYLVVSLLASKASLVDLISAPMWIVAGLVVLVIHVVIMFVLSKLFHWDLCMVSTSSLANIGGSASAPIVASAYNSAYAGIGVLMGVIGAAIGNFCGIAIAYILQIFC